MHRWSMRYTSVRGSVPDVRAEVTQTLHSWCCGSQTVSDAVLITNELAANAVCHGHVRGRFFEVTVTREAGELVIEVSDAHPEPPRLNETDDDTDEGGRGLRIVEMLSTKWGSREGPGGIGKTVWARLPMTAEGHATL
ncbi:ATP-binding protein [Streptomyces gobiensis]|uniref:ATP-binding protein n=1 Tax=Streptomyces gobiensis TaxID=2875706 RepID=UPI001E3FA73A|nr:ATP-binding protein [Streptomyces gobiensis]UGY94244.1 ATP-binding protein [Streptomyces gobiensis]